MADTADRREGISTSFVATRIHLLPPAGTVLFKCDKCGFVLAEVRYTPRGDYRYIRMVYRQQSGIVKNGILERHVGCPHCDASDLTEPDFTAYIASA